MLHVIMRLLYVGMFLLGICAIWQGIKIRRNYEPIEPRSHFIYKPSTADLRKANNENLFIAIACCALGIVAIAYSSYMFIR